MRALLPVMVLAAALSACGYKGPLHLPKPKPEAQQPASPPAPQQDEKKPGSEKPPQKQDETADESVYLRLTFPGFITGFQ